MNLTKVSKSHSKRTKHIIWLDIPSKSINFAAVFFINQQPKSQISITNELDCPYHNRPIMREQHCHDIRLVWPLEASADGSEHTLATYSSNSLLLGNRLARIHVYGSRQPHWFFRKWRPLLPYATQSNSRGNNPHCLHHFRHTILQERTLALEPLCIVHILDYGSVFRFYESGLSRE